MTPDEYRIGRWLSGSSRAAGFGVVTAAYVLAGAVALGLAAGVDGHPLLVTLLADVAATVVVFLCSMVVANSSLYDPYWSVAPPVIVAAWIVSEGAGANQARQLIVFALVLLWAIRLTANWASSWRGLSHEDWRYVRLREQTRGRVPWWVVSLTGIQLMPTLVVFDGLLAVWPAVGLSQAARPLGVLDALAVLVTVTAIAVETLADLQLRRFAADPANRGHIVDRGLWRYSRHPNYLGEIGFWWGMWLFGLAAAPGWWWTVIGPIAMLALFVFVSVPMMDRRSLERRPNYAEHAQRVPALFPIPRRRTTSPS
jgi:steroid 5-alpha reductase family enzyme